MKILLSLILCGVVGQSAAAPQRQSDRAREGFVGPVKKVFEVWTPVSGINYPEGSKCSSLTDEYDQAGRIVRHSVYPGSCGELEIREDYSYAEDGTQTSKVQDIRNTNSPQFPPGVNSNEGTMRGPLKKTFKYDATGRMVEANTFYADGKLAHKITFSYDAKGRLVETTGYDAPDQMRARRVFGYSDDKRVPSTFVYYQPNGQVAERTTYSDYEFNSQGDWIRRKQNTEEPFTRRGIEYPRRSVSIMVREIEYYPNK